MDIHGELWIVTIHLRSYESFMEQVFSKSTSSWGARKLAMGKMGFFVTIHLVNHQALIGINGVFTAFIWENGVIVFCKSTPYFPIAHEVCAPFKGVF